MVPYFEGHIKTGIIRRARIVVVLFSKNLVICFVNRKEYAAEKKRAAAEARRTMDWQEETEDTPDGNDRFGERFAALDEQTAAALDARNRVIPYAEILKTRYSRASEDCDGEMNICCQGRLKIWTKSGRMVIRHGIEKGTPQEKELLKRLKPDKAF